MIRLRSALPVLLPALLCLASGAWLLAQDQQPNPAARNPHLGNKASIRGGMALYRVRCADCHGLDASGYRGPDLYGVIASGVTDERLFDTIRKGVPGTEMPPQGEGMSDDDVLQVIAYLRDLSSPPPERPVCNVENGSRIFA